jgi:hypothetical protein
LNKRVGAGTERTRAIRGLLEGISSAVYVRVTRQDIIICGPEGKLVLTGDENIVDC